MKIQKNLVSLLILAGIVSFPAMALGSKELKTIEIAHKTALGDSWEIRNMQLIYQTASGTMGETDNPVSGNVSPVYETVTVDLKDKDVEALLKIFSANGWQKLNTEYGVKEGERNYPESLRLRDSKGDKTVVYRSAPGAEKTLPTQFRTIADSIDKLVKKVIQR